jgi:rRNA-processing protein FCF1
MIELRPSAQLAEVRAVLIELARQVSDIRGAGGTPLDRLNAWRDWSARAPALARTQLSDKSVQEAVLGTRYAMLQTLSPSDYGSSLSSLIDTELQVRLDHLSEALNEVEAFAASWGSGRIAVLLDTNVLLAAGPRVAKIEWDSVLNSTYSSAAFAIPIQVVEELDRLKDRGSNETRTNARFALKWIDELDLHGDYPRPFGTKAPNTTIRVWVDENDRVPLAEVDRDIIDRAQQLAPFTKRTVIASMDRSMVLRARTYGLTAALLTEEDIPPRAEMPAPS